MAKYLKQTNCTLEALHIGNNKISDFGAKALSQALASNKSLIHIDMTYNQIGDRGLLFVAQSLFRTQTLLSFKLFGGNNFGQESLSLFYKLLVQTPRQEAPWFPDFVVYWVDNHFEMAYLETNVETETDIGSDLFVCR